MKPSIARLGCAVAVLLAAGQAGAMVVFDAAALGPAKVIDFEAFAGSNAPIPYVDPVPIGGPVGENVLLISSNDPFVLGKISTDLGDNGQWTGNDAYAGVNFGSGYLIFDLGRDFAGAGGFVNFNPAGRDTNPSSFAALDDSFNVLDSVELAISTPNGSDAGAFFGFVYPTARIRFLLLDGNFPVIDDLTLADPQAAQAPEPQTLALVALALLGAGTFARRRQTAG